MCQKDKLKTALLYVTISCEFCLLVEGRIQEEYTAVPPMYQDVLLYASLKPLN